MSIIDDFIDNYRKAYDAYDNIRDHAEKTIKQLLKDAGIMAIVSSRVKDPDRLKDKLLNRNTEAHYTTFNDIISDIPDFIGTRIALYFPNDKERIQNILSHDFVIEKIKTFPNEQKEYDGYERRFSGYCATHYRVRFKRPPTSILENPLIEIQVASLLMHAWSEVEHDLAYKNLKGEVSFDEYESLDEINGLVIACEVSLQRLQRLSQARIESGEKTISDHYQLASYLTDRVYNITQKRDIDLGDVETLFQVLSVNERLTRKKLDNDLAKIDFYDETPIAQQLCDYYANKSIKNTKRIINNKVKKNNLDESILKDAQIGSFIQKWISLEKKLEEIEKLTHNSTHQAKNRYIHHKKYLIPEFLWQEYDTLRKFRNELVHGIRTPTSIDIAEQEKIIDKILKTITEYYEL